MSAVFRLVAGAEAYHPEEEGPRGRACGLAVLPWSPIACRTVPTMPNPAYTHERGFRVLPPDSSPAGRTKVQSFLGNRPVFG